MHISKKEQWPSGRALVSRPEGPGIESSFRKVGDVLKMFYFLFFLNFYKKEHRFVLSFKF